MEQRTFYSLSESCMVAEVVLRWSGEGEEVNLEQLRKCQQGVSNGATFSLNRCKWPEIGQNGNPSISSRRRENGCSSKFCGLNPMTGN